MTAKATTAQDLVIGIDCSTTATKAIVWDREGAAVAEGRCAIPLLMPQPAWHEQPAESWWTATAQALREAVGQVELSRVAALCITAQRETFVPVDQNGQPLRQAIVWMDERCRSLLPELARLCSRDAIHEATGKPLSGNLSLGKIFWLKKYEPAVFERAFKWLDVHAFLVHKLTGYFRTAWGCADPTGLFDLRKQDWADELIQAIGLRAEQLPDLFPTGEIIGEVTPEAAAVCGLPAGLPVVAGIGDGQAAALGTNITRPGIASLSLGTSVVSGTLAETYLADRAFRTTNSAVRDAFLLEAVILSGTYLINWFLENWSADRQLEALEEAVQHVPPGSLGLMLVPYWNSVMNPYWDAGASGLVVGWRGIHNRTHLYRSILEGIAFEIRLHLDGMQTALGTGIESLVAGGGGAHSSTWCQILADITGKPIFRSTTSEAAALGAGILAAHAAGLYADLRTAAAAMTRIETSPFVPDPARSAFYRPLYEQVYRHLFPALQTYLDRLTELTEPREQS